MVNTKNWEIIQFAPVKKRLIWGSEDWVIAAHDKGNCTVSSGKYVGMTLRELWEQHRELFGGLEGDRFPLLIKEIIALDDLSIQVHPDDTYADIHEEHSLGKNECWYILDCKDHADLILGHTASDRREAEQMVSEGRWHEFIRTVPVQDGDFFQIDAGCVHAIKGGIRLLEIEQNSDITYRLYDYDRKYKGEPRELHIEKSLDVLGYGDVSVIEPEVLKEAEEYSLSCLVKNHSYEVYKLELNGVWESEQKAPFLCISITSGNGKIDGLSIREGQHLMLPFGYGEYRMEGEMTALISTVPHEV